MKILPKVSYFACFCEVSNQGKPLVIYLITVLPEQSRPRGERGRLAIVSGVNSLSMSRCA